MKMVKLNKIFETYYQKLSSNNKKRVQRLFIDSGSTFDNFNILYPYLASEGLMSLNEWEKILFEFNERNQYLYTANFSPRDFGTWGEKIIKEKWGFAEPKDSSYDAEYQNKKIEIKSSRVTFDKKQAPIKNKTSLKDRMKSFELADDNKDKMNFEQIKIDCCDVFIFNAVYTDKIRHWVIPANELNSVCSITKQHRGSNGSEGQVWGYPAKMKKYECTSEEIINKIKTL